VAALDLKARARQAFSLFTLSLHPRRCDSSECTGNHPRWKRTTSNTGRVRLHGSSFCLIECFEREIRRTLEQTQHADSFWPTKPRRIPLGLIMLSRGELSNHQLQRALEAQACAGRGRIGEWVRNLGFAEEAQIAAALAKQWACPLMRTLPARPANDSVPLQLLQSFRMVPVHFSKVNRILHVAFAGDIEYRVLFSIERMLACKTEPCLTTKAQIEAALARVQARNPSEEKLFENCDTEEMVRILSNYSARLCAAEVRTAHCGEFFWARILSGANSIDLLFSRRRILPTSAGYTAGDWSFPSDQPRR